MEDRIRLHYDSLSRLVEFTKSADAKAVPLLASHIVLIGALAAKFGPILHVLRDGPEAQKFAVAALLAFYLVSTIAASSLAARVFVPINPNLGQSLIYFQDIAGMPYEAFLTKSQQLEPGDIELELIQQIYQVAQVVKTKMFRVRWAFILSIPTALSWLALIGWGSV